MALCYHLLSPFPAFPLPLTLSVSPSLASSPLCLPLLFLLAVYPRCQHHWSSWWEKCNHGIQTGYMASTDSFFSCLVSFFHLTEMWSYVQISYFYHCSYLVNKFFSDPMNFQQSSHSNFCSFSGGRGTWGKPTPALFLLYLGTPAGLLQCHQH